MLSPVHAQVAFVETGHVWGEPRRDMDAVRHDLDRTLGFTNIGPDRGPHRARHLPMDAANSVDRTRAAQGQSSHVKHRPGAAIIGRELQKTITVYSECVPVARQVGLYEVKWKRIVAGSYRSMRGKDRGAADLLKGCFETLAALHRLAHALKHNKRRMSLIE